MSRSAIMGNTELQLRAQVAALEQLLEIHERTTIEQSEKLEEALRASAAHAKQVEWSEQRARLLVETAVDAIVTMDESGAIVQANPATERIFGYAPEELAGQPMTHADPGALPGGAPRGDGALSRNRGATHPVERNRADGAAPERPGNPAGRILCGVFAGREALLHRHHARHLRAQADRSGAARE